ncbi:DUF3794 and LysM peptidoglycan-binding domain-containing protein [Novisyntrophococcus fermenticellae]|uniref:DUF3794 and LysM peptidoglycan-binding domain-containing protein n=1 Tax=Novisyntrophococcus fermenticellae TaxID=2068655 RepID=UPI001E33656B|nr:SPOCS domain-containing protein [Novisyntrophococcus fermenticellae]
MELMKKNLHQICRKSDAETQITFDEDFNVPDAKPDVGRMIQKKGEVNLQEVQVSEGHARITGSLDFYLLYVSDGDVRRIYNLDGSLPIDENINLDGLNSGDKICLKWEMEDLSIHLINSRKLNIRALITFYAYVEEIQDIQLPTDLKESEGVSVKKEEIPVLELGVHKKDTMRIKKELTLASNKPNIHTILWQDMQTRALDIRGLDGKVEIKGELFVFCLYSGDDEDHPLQYLEQALPWQQEVDCSGSTTDMIPNIDVTMTQCNMEVVPDADGEERVLQMDVVLELDMKLYKENSCSLLQDVYTPKKKCILTTEPRVLESLLVKNYSKCKVNDRVNVQEPSNKILQICHSEGTVKIDDTKVVQNGIQVDGIIQLRILYIISDDDMPFYSMETAVPFTHMVEAPGISKDCKYHLRSDIEQLSTTMIDSNDIEVKAVLNLNAIVMRERPMAVVSEISEEPLDMEELRSMPGIVCYLVQDGDTLWDIAKRFYTTVDEIRALNELESDRVKPMDSLMLVKKVE